MKQLSKTKVTVRLRRAEDRKEWYVYIESYPVQISGKKTPQRIREYLNRSVTTVEWDKKRTARTDSTTPFSGGSPKIVVSRQTGF